MPGGYGNIHQSDNPKPFKKGNKAAEVWTEEKAIQVAKDLIEWQQEKDESGADKGNMFFEEFLVIERGMHPNFIGQMRKKFTTFDELIDKAKKIQEIKLVKYGVGDRLNSSMTKFTLTNNHGWKDKVESKNLNEEVRHIIDYSKGD